MPGFCINLDFPVDRGLPASFLQTVSMWGHPGFNGAQLAVSTLVFIHSFICPLLSQGPARHHSPTLCSGLLWVSALPSPPTVSCHNSSQNDPARHMSCHSFVLLLFHSESKPPSSMQCGPQSPVCPHLPSSPLHPSLLPQATLLLQLSRLRPATGPLLGCSP
jgi:hypothetical protein